MTIECRNDINYPYAIYDDWEGKVYCNKQDLIILRREINKILEEEPPQPKRVPSYGGIGAQMIANFYETRR